MLNMKTIYQLFINRKRIVGLYFPLFPNLVTLNTRICECLKLPQIYFNRMCINRVFLRIVNFSDLLFIIYGDLLAHEIQIRMDFPFIGDGLVVKAFQAFSICRVQGILRLHHNIIYI